MLGENCTPKVKYAKFLLNRGTTQFQIGRVIGAAAGFVQTHYVKKELIF